MMNAQSSAFASGIQRARPPRGVQSRNAPNSAGVSRAMRRVPGKAEVRQPGAGQVQSIGNAPNFRRLVSNPPNHRRHKRLPRAQDASMVHQNGRSQTLVHRRGAHWSVPCSAKGVAGMHLTAGQPGGAFRHNTGRVQCRSLQAGTHGGHTSVQPDAAATWVALVQSAAHCSSRKECLHLLRSMAAAGYDLPLRLLLLASKSEGGQKAAAEATLREEIRHLLTSLCSVEGPSVPTDAPPLEPSWEGGPRLAGDMANALMDLLWRFGQHMAALGVLLVACSSQLRILPSLSPAFSQPNPFCPGTALRAPTETCNLWTLDVSSLGPGGALAALHFWLDCVQDLALTGAEPPRHGLIATGGRSSGEALLVRRTLHYHLWARSAPVWITEGGPEGLLCKGYSLFRWIKDSPHCLSLELHDLPFVPERNGLLPFEGGLVTEEVAHVLELLKSNGVPMQRPKVFSRLLRITDERRNQWIRMQAEMTESRKERAEKRAKMKAHNRARRQKRRLEKKHSKGRPMRSNDP